ncbi:CU044_2847 family protein [Streptomyces longwoodensis]
MTIVVGPVPEGADGPVPIEIESNLSLTGQDGLDLVYGDEVTRDAAGRRVVRVAQDAYSDAIDLARRCAGQAVRRFAELGEDVRPDEIEMQLAIKVDAGVVALVKSGAEAQLQVTFRWSTARPPAEPAGRQGGNS